MGKNGFEAGNRVMVSGADNCSFSGMITCVSWVEVGHLRVVVLGKKD